MLRIEIAGHTLTYKNAPQLNEKARVLLEELRGERETMEKQTKALRRQEYLVQKFLGGVPEAQRDTLLNGFPHGARLKEEKSHA